MKTLDELLKEPETTKEKLEDLWDDITNIPRRIKEGWWAIKRFFRNLRRYWGILWNDNDFDQGYMEELLILKLTLMADYFRTARIAVGAENTYHKINLAVRIGKIAFDMENTDDPELFGGEFGLDYLGHVNTRNSGRFWKHITQEKFEDPKLGRFNRTELRQRKARHLFYRFLDAYSMRWWD